MSLGVLLIALFVVMRAGEYQSFGPLDLETADRLAIALWVTAPIAGGLAARAPRIASCSARRSASAWWSASPWRCSPRADRAVHLCQLAGRADGYLLGRLAVGGLAGVGMAAGLLVTGVSTRSAPTALPGIVVAAAINLGASVAAYELFYGGVRCL